MATKKRKLSLIQILRKFPDDEAAEQWFIDQRWKNGVYCPHCGCFDVNEGRNARNKRRFRCRPCRKDFSTKTGSLMESSNLGFQAWAIAIYQLTTNIKGIAPTKLASDLDVTQKTAWMLAMKIHRVYFENDKYDPNGIVEINETYVGGKKRNKHSRSKLQTGRRKMSRRAVPNMKQRGSKRVKTKPVAKTNRLTPHTEIHDNVATGSTIYTDEHRSYLGLNGGKYQHTSVKHNVGEYADEQARTTSIKSFWALLKRDYRRIRRHMSRKHPWRYVNEFAKRNGLHDIDTMNAMRLVAGALIGKKPPYGKLTT